MPYSIISREIQGGTFNDVGRDLTNNINHGVLGHHVQIEKMSVTCSHACQALVRRTMYDEFRQVLLGDVIALQNVHHEDLSEYEWQFRGGKILGRLRAHAITQTVQLFPHGGTKFTLVKYEGADADKAWKRDFRTFSETREPGSPQLFAINFSRIPMLIFHHMDHTPIISMQVKDLDGLLRDLSWNFGHLVTKCQRYVLVFLLGVYPDEIRHRYWPWLVDGAASLFLPPRVGILTKFTDGNLPDGVWDRVKQLTLFWTRLDWKSSQKEWDWVLQQLLHSLHVWGCEIDSEAGEKDYSKWIRLKDSCSIQELDDNDEDFLSNSTSSSTKRNSRTRSTQKDPSPTRCDHSNTTQGARAPTTKPSIKPTQRKLPNSQARPLATTLTPTINEAPDMWIGGSQNTRSAAVTAFSASVAQAEDFSKSTMTAIQTLASNLAPACSVVACSAGGPASWRSYLWSG